ncbi:hypothetical protein OPV22_001610 [Ensete ventricosum]|uniref:PPPDE domain-containing protein n=1 Tax=Ensete ventricosum TaxID=4639 RepID=A0AAV8QCS8_ENSVE|nr:hypothetical protein OPV22_001610 [Ensete ventricosum]
MQEVVAHVYDVTNSPSAKTNNTVTRINCIFKDCIGLGGIFHSAIQVYGTHEWSFGYRERGSGVFHCSTGQNQFYTHRQSIVLGETHCSRSEVNKILKELIRAWTGDSYDPLSKNCNHFCDAFCEKLGVRKLPGWVNRFANTCNTAMGITQNAASCLRQAKAEIGSAIKVASKFIATQASNSPRRPKSQSDGNQGSPHDMISRLKYMISFCSTSQIPDETADPTESS